MAELEGFLCPLCKEDCRSVRELEAHYREEHEEHEESSTSKLKNNFMNFVDKAKTTLKIDKSSKPTRDWGAGREYESSGSHDLDDGNPSAVMEGHVTNVSGISTELWEPQEMGRAVEYTAGFRRLRDSHFSEHVVATNRLIIRLEKLFRLLKENTPRNAKQMKSVEQGVVPWRRDEDEKQCQNCGKKFGVRRRRHHCRLCGCIICKQCSKFMTLAESYPLLCDCPDYYQLSPSPTPHRKSLQLAPRKKEGKPSQRDGEGDDEEGSDEIRMCLSCRQLADRRLLQLQATRKPVIVSFYEKMQEKMEESERLKPGFTEVANLLWSGHHLAGLDAASIQRQELLKVYESIDAISKKILSAGAAEPSPLRQKLSRCIRVFASNFLQENLMTLPSVPTMPQLQQIKEKKEREALERVREIERQREEQRQLNLRREAAAAADDSSSGLDKLSAGVDSGLGKISAKFSAEIDKLKDFSKDLQDKITFKKDEEVVSISSVRVGGGGEGGAGWMCAPEMVRNTDGEEDPFVVQREQLLSYIAQAREARRMDEVRALEQSLRDIELAMEEQQNMSYGLGPPH